MLGGWMPQAPIDDGFKVSATYETVLFPELCTFGWHTGARTSGAYSTLVTIMQDFLNDNVTILCPVEGRTITIYEWSTSGFTGWHQVAVFDDSANAYGGGAELPHQLQCVGTYVNDNELTVATGRRRNRSYVGPMRESTLEADGRINATDQTLALLAWTNLHTALEGLGGLLPAADFAGLCVVSEAEGVIMDATRAKVGQKYDIHRSRAQKTPESYAIAAL